MNPTQFSEYLAIAKSGKKEFDAMRKAVEDAPDTSNGTAWRDELLTVPEQLSPRLKWMKEHEVSTNYIDRKCYPWAAFIGPIEGVTINGEELGKVRFSDTEHDALVNLADANGWPMWNEATFLTP